MVGPVSFPLWLHIILKAMAGAVCTRRKTRSKDIPDDSEWWSSNWHKICACWKWERQTCAKSKMEGGIDVRARDRRAFCEGGVSEALADSAGQKGVVFPYLYQRTQRNHRRTGSDRNLSGRLELVDGHQI